MLVPLYKVLCIHILSQSQSIFNKTIMRNGEFENIKKGINLKRDRGRLIEKIIDSCSKTE